jgi:hypothetical protein
LIGRLSQDERAAFLFRLAEGDPGVGLALRKRLNAFLPQERPRAAKPRTVQQLHQRAKELETAEQKRRAEAARKKQVAEMTALAAREAQAWQQVDDLLAMGRKIASVCDEATGILERLKQLSEFQERRDDFRARVRQLAQKYGTRPSLIERWRKRGWV